QQCPAEKLNKKRYHKNWLQNLLIATSNARKKKTPNTVDSGIFVEFVYCWKLTGRRPFAEGF
ncbi:MAG: hypothetical protein LBC20_06985, partial [Planctomycetaceae bacterium]|nr:hypothetical protein [Planctomycetaceae bacterium]